MKPLTEIEQEIREACIKANPSIKDTAHRSIGNNLRCSRCGELDNYDNRGTCPNGDIRSIRLADILLAMKKHSMIRQMVYLMGVDSDSDGDFYFTEDEDVFPWNLLHDDLSIQSEETKRFIHQVLYGE